MIVLQSTRKSNYERIKFVIITNYEKKFLLNDFVKGKRIFNDEVVEGRFNGFYLHDKLDPTSVVGVIDVGDNICYYVVVKSIELLENEDERIRKEIMNFVVANTICKDERREKYLAWLEKQDEQGNQHLYDIIIALQDLLDKIDTFADLKIDNIDPDNPFKKIEDITCERHKFVKSDGYSLYIKREKITENYVLFDNERR